MVDDKGDITDGGWCSAWQGGRRIHVLTGWDQNQERFVVYIYGDNEFEVRNELPGYVEGP